MTSSLDAYRLKVMKHLTTKKSFAESWPYWEETIGKTIGDGKDASAVFSLGGQLSEVFRSRSVRGRDNSALSQGGVAWEGLVCWYLNLVLWGTNVLAMTPKKGLIPEVITDALTVSIQNVATNTESDIVVFSVPDVSDHDELNLDLIDERIRANPTSCTLSVVQCKTNWNDNAQIPMLWDLLYNAGSVKSSSASIGLNGFSPSSFGAFRYSFVTVPTVNTVFKANSLAVLRVRGLSGGNYWGRPTETGVAKSLSEYFTAVFPTAFNGSVINHIEQHLASGHIERFLNLNFSETR